MQSTTSNHQHDLHWQAAPLPELLRLAWPIVVSVLSYATMTLVDTAFVAQLGSSALAGVGLGGMVAFFLICYPMGVLRAAKTLISQARGAGNHSADQPYLMAALVSAGLLGLIITGLALWIGPQLALISATEAAAAQANTYLSVRAAGLLPVLGYIALREARYGMGDTRSPMLAAVVGNLVNIGLDYLLIVVLQQGVAGAAWATVVSQCLEMGMLLWLQHREGMALGSLSRAYVRNLWKLGHPMGAQFILEVSAFGVLTAMLASLSDVDMAAHQVALQVTHFAFLPALALGDAGSVLVGQAVGAGRNELVVKVARCTLAVASSYTLLCTLAFALAAEPMAAFFCTEPELQVVAAQLLQIAAWFIVFDGANVVARCALRGTGDVNFAAYVGIGLAWAVTPGMTWLLAYELGMGAVGAWSGLCLEIIACASVLWWRLEKQGWQPAARRYFALANA